MAIEHSDTESQTHKFFTEHNSVLLSAIQAEKIGGYIVGLAKALPCTFIAKIPPVVFINPPETLGNTRESESNFLTFTGSQKFLCRSRFKSPLILLSSLSLVCLSIMPIHSQIDFSHINSLLRHQKTWWSYKRDPTDRTGSKIYCFFSTGYCKSGPKKAAQNGI